MLREESSVEQAFDALWTYKDKGHLDESIDVLRNLGHHQFAVDLVLRPDSYYFPKRQGNRIVIPEGTRADKIAVVALSSGERVSYEQPTVHHVQRTALGAAGISRWVLSDADREFKTMDDTIAGNGGSDGGASIYTRKASIKDDPAHTVESKPVIIFNRGDAATRYGAGLVLHEMVHLAQSLSYPIRSSDSKDRLRCEFEATGVQAPLVRSYIEPLDGFNETALAMDNFRRLYLGEGNYLPDDYAMEEFAVDGRFARILASLE